jgi:hypothetical protein
MGFRKKIKDYVQAPITHHLVMDVLAEYRRPNDKINDLVKKGELISLRRGLYVPGPEVDLPIPNSFLIANHLRGPSYVSLTSALSYWGMIPERVTEVSSITIKTSKTYNTPIGRYSFQQGKSPYYSLGIERIELAPQQVALIASREKALCDIIVYTPGVLLRSVSQTIDYLIDDMRIDEESLRQLSLTTISSWIEYAPKKNSLQILIKTLQKL